MHGLLQGDSLGDALRQFCGYLGTPKGAVLLPVLPRWPSERNEGTPRNMTRGMRFILPLQRLEQSEVLYVRVMLGRVLLTPKGRTLLSSFKMDTNRQRKWLGSIARSEGSCCQMVQASTRHTISLRLHCTAV